MTVAGVGMFGETIDGVRKLLASCESVWAAFGVAGEADPYAASLLRIFPYEYPNTALLSDAIGYNPDDFPCIVVDVMDGPASRRDTELHYFHNFPIAVEFMVPLVPSEDFDDYEDPAREALGQNLQRILKPSAFHRIGNVAGTVMPEAELLSGTGVLPGVTVGGNAVTFPEIFEWSVSTSVTRITNILDKAGLPRVFSMTVQLSLQDFGGGR